MLSGASTTRTAGLAVRSAATALVEDKARFYERQYIYGMTGLSAHEQDRLNRELAGPCAQVADALERTLQVPLDEADTRLRSIAGVGVWTSAEVRFRAHGDADAVSFGDYHIAKEIGHALLGRDMDDAELAELLEPYRPHRHRVQALLGMRRWRERHGPRMAPRTHLPAN